MFVDKSLLIKGIAGVAAIGVGGTGFVYKEEIRDLFKSKEQKDRRRINGILGSLGLGEDCRLDDKIDPSSFSKECGLDEGKLKKINFSNKGEGELTVKPSSSFPTDLKLKIEGTKGGIGFSFTGLTSGSDLKLFGDKTKGKIVLKSDKKFKVEGGKLTKDSTGVEAKLKSKLEEFNKQLGSVNAPQECRFDESEGETSVECSVTPDELKKIAFSKGEGGELTYSSDSSDFTGMKLKVNTHEEMINTGTGDLGKVMYLTFKDYNKKVKLMKGNKEVVSLVKDTNPEFEIYKEDNSEVYLVREFWDLDYIWPTLGLKKCTIEDGKTQGECTLDDMVKTIKVKKENSDDHVELNVTDTTNNKLEIHKDQEGFNQGFKFVFRGKTVTENSATLESDKEYEFKWKLQSNTKIGYLSKK